MKTIILCEGENDALFLEELCEKNGVDKRKRKIFNQNTNDPSANVRRAESDCFRRFFETSNPTKMLIKSEAGKSKLISMNILTHLIVYLFDNRINIAIALDLDGGKMESALSDIFSIIRSKLRTCDLITRHEKISETQNIILSKATVSKIDGNKELERGIFFIAAFKRSLDDAAGITDKSDSIDTKRAKVRRLLERDAVFGRFASELLQ